MNVGFQAKLHFPLLCGKVVCDYYRLLSYEAARSSLTVNLHL